MISKTGEPSELRHVRHQFGKSLQHGSGPSKCNATSILLIQLGVFSQERQSILRQKTQWLMGGVSHQLHVSFFYNRFRCCTGIYEASVFAEGHYSEDGVVVAQSGPSLTGIAGYREHHNLCFINLLPLKDTAIKQTDTMTKNPRQYSPNCLFV